MLTRFITLAVALGALAATAEAQQAVRGMAACRTDMATFCAGIEAGGGKRVQCLTANKDKLSADCAAIIQQRTAQAPAGTVPAAPGANIAPPAAQPSAPAPATAPGSVPGSIPGSIPGPAVKGAKAGNDGGRMAACRPDLQALCASVPAGGGAKIRCLQDNQAKHSPACAQTIGELKSAKQAARGACATDANTFCPGLKGPQRKACFAENQAKFSPACTAALAKRAQR